MFYRPALPIPAETLLRCNSQFSREAWRIGMRHDQREANQLRPLSIEFPFLTDDVTLVRCGDTAATATVTCDLVEPSPFRPKHGFLEFHVRQLLHERDSLEKPKEIKKISWFLERLFKNNVLDPEGLCVLPGRKVWSLSVDILIVNDDGNTLDVAEWSAITALQHFRRPEITIRGDNITVHSPHERDPVPLSLHYIPVSCSYAVTTGVDTAQLHHRAAESVLAVSADPTGTGGDAKGKGASAPKENELLLVVDPSLEEEAAAASKVVVAVNAEGVVCALEKYKGCDVTWPILNECIQITNRLVPRILDEMKTAMAEHEVRRKEAFKEQFLWAQQRTGVHKLGDDGPHAKAVRNELS
ncbi:unnamed protein product [Phytomonas sp. EM1]|nr:unnamed protein product [Phytomonas sp. EM1]|eukprot:CCW62001.1 unnamed protein product [Phytomonas sp. isolate EM1]